MIFRSNDLAFMVGGAFGSVVQFNGSTAQGLFDEPEVIRLADQGFGGVQATNPAIKLAYNAFSLMPTNKATLIIDGLAYTVIEHTTSGDAAVISYLLKGPIS